MERKGINTQQNILPGIKCQKKFVQYIVPTARRFDILKS